MSEFLLVLWYNGYRGEIVDLLHYIKNCEEENIDMPCFLRVITDCDYPMRLLWSTLVVRFGDFGTSPRYGWLLKVTKDECVEELQEFIDTHNDNDEYDYFSHL